MIRPKTIEIQDLAKRWGCQPKQIIEAAIDGQIKLYFSLGYGVIADLPNPNPGHRLQMRPYQGSLQVDQPTLSALLHTNEARDVKEAYTPEGALVYVELPPHGLSPQLGGRTMRMPIQMAQPLNIKADDLHTFMDHVEANESTGRASSALTVSAPAAPPEAVLMPQQDVPVVAESWHLKKPKRERGYNFALYQVLKAAQVEGKPCPKARDVLDSWKAMKPRDITEVMPDGFKYTDSQGNMKEADLKCLQQAIARMTRAQ